MSQTNRKYIAKMKRSKINMAEAVQELSANAFKLLGLIYYNVIDLDNLDNDTVMKLLGVSRRPFFSAKDELKDNIIFVKGDLHQSAISYGHNFKYHSVGSFFGASEWVHKNFGNTQAVCDYSILDSKNNIIDGQIKLQ